MPTTKTPCVNTARLLKLADFLDKLPRSHFNFNTVLEKVPATKENECGTVGCAIGWCPTVFPRTCKAISVAGNAFPESVIRVGKRDIDTGWARHGEVAEALFGMKEEDAYLLFTPGKRSPADGKVAKRSAAPASVARRIRAYVKWHKAGRK